MKYQFIIYICFLISSLFISNCLLFKDVSGAITQSISYEVDFNNPNSHFQSNRLYFDINSGIDINVRKITFNASFYLITLYIERKSERISLLPRNLKFLSISY